MHTVECRGCGKRKTMEGQNEYPDAIQWCTVECYNSHPELHTANSPLRYDKGEGYQEPTGWA